MDAATWSIPDRSDVPQDLGGPQNPRLDAVTAKQDVALYAMIRFFDFSLLPALDPTISKDDLMNDTSGGLCDVRAPDVFVLPPPVCGHGGAASLGEIEPGPTAALGPVRGPQASLPPSTALE
jgi:hypothetical protein